MNGLFENLNSSQHEAVITTEGPVMVMAGAGSGKTRVLTNRIAYLIEELGVPSYSILAVTFTNKAAREMKERISRLVSVDTRQMWVSTFHSICARLLRLEIKHLNDYTPNFTIIDEEDAIKIIREITSNLNLDSKEYPAKKTRKIISDLKNDKTKDIKDKHIFSIYKEYQSSLIKQDLLDFDDLILVTIRLFKECKEVLEKYQNKFQYVMIDEFQDTNTSQYELIRLLSYKHKNIFVVGDQDQSIYSFRGARVENIDHFRADYPSTKLILLVDNYRSTKQILDIANRVIDNNKNRIKKELVSINQSGEKPVYYQADSSYDEVMFVIDKIKELVASGYSYRDFAVIYRANALSRSFEDSLVRYKMPYVIYGGLSFFSRKEIKDIISYLRLIVNNDDDFALKRIVNEPKRKIGPALLTKLTDQAIESKTSLFKSIDALVNSSTGINNLIDFKFMIIELYEALIDDDLELPDIIDIILDKTGYYDMLKNEGEEGRDRLENIREFKSVLREADEFYEGTKLEKLTSVLSDLALRTDADNKSEDDNSIKLMTFHQSKGLEYKVVFLVAFEQGIFPSNNCMGTQELEEERRICYVGITRAKEKLYITSANNRYLYGGSSHQFPSVYINEMGKENLNVIGNTPSEFLEIKRISKVIKEEVITSVSYKIGEKINHKAFGDGMVVEVNDEIITVAFSIPYGIKKLNGNHPTIRKIK